MKTPLPDGMNAMMPPEDAAMSSNEDCVSLASLAMPDPESGDQMQTPEVGDKVSFTVDGTVTRIEGDQAYVKRDAVNGEPVEKAESEKLESGNEDPDEGGALRNEASNMEGM